MCVAEGDDAHGPAHAGNCSRHASKIRNSLEGTPPLLKAPEACAERGKTDKAVEIALDLDLIREVNTFLSATA